MATIETTQDGNLRAEAWLALAYFTIYMVYMFVRPEGELMHWLSLVLLPLLLISLYQRFTSPGWSLRTSLRTIGLRRGNLKTGLAWAIPFGLGLSLVIQLFLSSNREAFRQILLSGKVLYFAPLAFVLLLVTVGITEEFFFRGVLQTRLTALFKSNVLAVLATSILFGLYHLPYAYLKPTWPTHGDLGAAFIAAMSNGILGGIVLGGIYVLARGNLIAVIFVHALIDVFPAMTQIRFG
ncbi:MAG: CPBP family intramembrane metalloprotease [Gemmatimonadota bacterium]|nr:MAG: CPBP family intramembrane metalloprotease [Gemmatimonadota bacterium]